ncbi:alpha/beta-hydrolase [Neolentinus lepideus HHB14362 ss-1]|uniref:Alpha/beta-hydrolase n=1 Tax=Neolentinus lepideus HHB14362 ss-1 TaxID=1314782 RepID=A0A165Q3Z1_9AGAM|nr:alpha/beta-hydrolase [Neolentinus lepideus HHB14362 ss-1]
MPSNLIPSIEGFAKGAFATAAGLSTIGVGLLYYGQNFLIYPSAYPPGSRTEVPVPSDFGLPYEDLRLTTSDNVKIQCYLLVQKRDLSPPATLVPGEMDFPEDEFPATRPTIMMFHGNGGNMGHRVPLAKVFYIKMRCNVMMVSYRGYGRSEGSPSEKGLQQDAQTALDYLTSHPVLSRAPVILYGQSIGGAVSIDLASRNLDTVKALILENTFLSIPKLIPQALPILSPFSFLCHQKWESYVKLSKIPASTPMLMLSGKMDEVVPPKHMESLWKIAEKRGQQATEELKTEDVREERESGAGKNRFVLFEKGHHNDTCVQPGYWTAVSEFVAGLGEP